MSAKSKKIVFNTLFVTIITAVLVIIYFVAPSLAWFTDENNFENEGEVASIDISFLDGTNNVITTLPDITYNGAATHSLIIKAANTQSSTIGALVRVFLVAYWEGGLPLIDQRVVVNEGLTVQYTYNNSVWQQKNVNDNQYYFYNSVLMPNQSVSFLTEVRFPTLPSDYVGKKLTITAYVEGLQANNAGVAQWASVAPINWAPLG